MSPFGYLYDPRSDEEVAASYEIARKPYLTDEENDKLQDSLRQLLIRDRQRFRERAEVWLKMKQGREQK
jgi:hypothetical protein